METKRKIYFAHSKLIYGSQQEKEELQFLRKKFPNRVICPNNDIGELNDFKKYLKIVDSCSQVIISEYYTHVGRGVFSEIARAFANGTLISVLRKQANKYALFQVTGIEMVNQYDWKIKFGKLIVKK